MSSDGPQRRDLSTARGAISALVWPAPHPGAPRLVFLHATGFNAQTYVRLLSPLASRFEIVAPDARGHGRCALPADPESLSSWQVYVDDLQGLLEVLPGPSLLAGHSLGAVVAMRAAAAPGRASAVVMVEPVMPPPAACWLLAWMRRLGLHRRLPLVARTARRRRLWPDADALAAAYRGRGAFATWPDEVLADYISGGTRGEGDQLALSCDPAWESRSFEVTAYDSWPSLSFLDRSPIILYGGRSYTFNRRSARAAARRCPGIQIIRRADASHFLPMEEPQVVRDAILGALTEPAR